MIALGESQQAIDLITRSEELLLFFFFSSRRRHTRFDCDWSSDVCSSDLDARVVLEARGIKKTYGIGARALTVLTDANLSLRRGEMVAIVAPSGAGKSTFLHLL